MNLSDNFAQLSLAIHGLESLLWQTIYCLTFWHYSNTSFLVNFISVIKIPDNTW